MANPFDVANKANEALKKGQEIIDTPNKVIKQGKDLQKQGEKTVEGIKELSGQQVTIKIGAKTKDSEALEARLAAHGFETNGNKVIDVKEAIRLEEFIKGLYQITRLDFVQPIV